ncbi:MAG: CPBP family intramembrane metalloprotease [Candidatus Aminicenantes bacterium]|nr:MAG: CPBP family intramembrane metalloprotease [Candidatus Aminicenantes bacterium]
MADEKAKLNSIDLAEPDAFTIFQIIINTLKKLRDKTAIILWSSFILLTVWGFKGDTQLFFNLFGNNWLKELFPGIPWRNQLFSFLSGFILLVIIPCCIIKFVFKEKLSEYGLGWPKGKDKIKLSRVAILVTLGIGIPVFFLGTFDPGMQAEYPLFEKGAITTWGGFIVYELVYFLFFIVIEFIFRGYLLFGLYGIEDVHAVKGVKGIKGPLIFGLYAILIQMLAYTMWHIGKPVPEYVGALVWGVAVAAVALRIRSIWPIIFVHWILNVFVDVVMCIRFNLIPG